MPDQPMSHSHSVPMHTPWKEQSFSQAARSRELLQPVGQLGACRAMRQEREREREREKDRQSTRTGEKLRACRKRTQFARELLVLSHEAHGGDQ